MKTAIDTNILSALWSREPFAREIAERLWQAKMLGGLVICPVVLAEALAHPRVTEEAVERFLKESEITVEYELSTRTWHEAGRRFAQYAGRRRRSGSKAGAGLGSEEPKRLLADFLIGAHGLLQADRLMTLDARRYQQDFPELSLL
ncbi:MAG: type II toxin-antitoxin system VapC family toxin [Acidobacteria bacterium]|nr:type II toxin-antitoxin system VapC family toxin [Acidobacteriota bacterium]